MPGAGGAGARCRSLLHDSEGKQVPECHAEGLRGQGRGALSDGAGFA